MTAQFGPFKVFAAGQDQHNDTPTGEIYGTFIGEFRAPADTITTFSSASVAAAGSGQSTYTAIADQVNAVTAADGTKGVALPAAAAGKAIFIINTSQTAVLPVAPVNGGNDAINALTAGTGVFTMGPARAAWFIPVSATQWYVSGDAAVVGTPTEQDLDGILATVAELNRAADVSTRVVALAATSLAVTTVLHEGKIVSLNHTGAASTATLPAATGTGGVFRFIVGAVNTSNHVITHAGSDVFKGSVNLLDNDSNAQTAYAASGTDNTLTLNGTTTGGQVGDWVEFVDIASGVWAVRGQLVCPAGSNVADPFSAT